MSTVVCLTLKLKQNAAKLNFANITTRLVFKKKIAVLGKFKSAQILKK